MPDHIICWIAMAFATIGVSGFGILLRVVWARLTVCETARQEFFLTLAAVETKLFHLEKWKLELELNAN